jgi:hypothetical protein
MATEPVNYEDVLADLEAKKTQIEVTITGIRALMGLGLSSSPSPTPGGPGGGATPRPGHPA